MAEDKKKEEKKEEAKTEEKKEEVEAKEAKEEKPEEKKTDTKEEAKEDTKKKAEGDVKEAEKEEAKEEKKKAGDEEKAEKKEKKAGKEEKKKAGDEEKAEKKEKKAGKEEKKKAGDEEKAEKKEKKSETKKEEKKSSKPEEKPEKPESKKKDITGPEIWQDVEPPLIFGKYDSTEVVVVDPSLKRYVNLEPRFVLNTGGINIKKSFGKMNVHVVERLINDMMRTEIYNGKKIKATKIVEKAFDIISGKTKRNPIQVLVRALQNSAPIEEITRLRFGGISVPKAVDTSAARRVDIALKNLCQGAIKSTYRTKKPVEQCLATELIKASEASVDSFAVSKRYEIERVAGSAR